MSEHVLYRLHDENKRLRAALEAAQRENGRLVEALSRISLLGGHESDRCEDIADAAMKDLPEPAPTSSDHLYEVRDAVKAMIK